MAPLLSTRHPECCSSVYVYKAKDQNCLIESACGRGNPNFCVCCRQCRWVTLTKAAQTWREALEGVEESEHHFPPENLLLVTAGVGILPAKQVSSCGPIGCNSPIAVQYMLLLPCCCCKDVIKNSGVNNNSFITDFSPHRLDIVFLENK